MSQSVSYWKFERSEDLSNLTHQSTGDDPSTVPDVLVFAVPQNMALQASNSVTQLSEFGIKHPEVSFEVDGNGYFKNSEGDDIYYSCRYHWNSSRNYFTVQYDAIDDLGNCIIIDLEIDALECVVVEAGFTPDFSECTPTP